MKIEIYRAMVPSNAIINDNHGQHYRLKQGKYDILYRQFERIRKGKNIKDENLGFFLPSVEEIRKEIPSINDSIKIRCEIFRYRKYAFDPPNYTGTFKPIIDKLIKYGYLKDDNYTYVESTEYSGGDLSYFLERAESVNDDFCGLTDILIDGDEGKLQQWWLNHSEGYNDIIVRVLIEGV